MGLGLISRLKIELEQAEQARVELGGTFMGSFPTPDSPTLLLDDLVFVPPSTLSSRHEYSLAPPQLRLLTEISPRGRPVVGFFRSHLRDAPIAPSTLDWQILQELFAEGVYAFLLIDGRHPRQGRFYLANGGRLPESPSTSAFPIDERAFRALPEVADEAPSEHGNDSQRKELSLPWVGIASIAILLFLIGLWTFENTLRQLLRPASNLIGLNVLSVESTLKITWDHSAPVLSKALAANLVISDGRNLRQLRLDTDDLRLGQVIYQRTGTKVYVALQLDTPGVQLPPQTYDWNGE